MEQILTVFEAQSPGAKPNAALVFHTNDSGWECQRYEEYKIQVAELGSKQTWKSNLNKLS